MQRPQLGAWLDADLLDERGARVLIGGERLRLAAGAVQREHPLGVQVLAQRLLGDERASSLITSACRPAARSASIAISVARSRRSSRRRISAAANGSPATSSSALAVPQRERLARAGVLEQPLEARRVDLAVGELELVAAAARDDLRTVRRPAPGRRCEM